MLVVITFSIQEVIVFFKILLEDFLIEFNLIVTFVGFLTIENIQGELESQVVYVFFS